MKIALASVPVVTGDLEHNLQVILDTVAQCGGKADLVLFGESVLQGFDCLSWDYETDRRVAVPLTDSSIACVCGAAQKHAIAVSFGFIERGDGVLRSSQIFIGSDGRIVHNFHRVSPGWKVPGADGHYVEGERFEAFSYGGKRVAIGLCGDLWTGDRLEEMGALKADIVLWPVWCDYDVQAWNSQIKYEYAERAGKCGENVFLVNPFCADRDSDCCAAGGGVHFCGGAIRQERPAGEPGVLIVEA